MSSILLRVILVLSMALVLAGTGLAQEAMGKKTRAVAHRFAANNSLFVLYHEVGHLLIDQLKLPVLGREEDAADNMATWTLLSKNTPAAHAALADAAYGWLLSGIAYGSNLDDSDYYASHSLDRQRAFHIVCLMVGSDDRSFRAIATEYAIDRDRQDTCLWDYELINRSMRSLMASHQPRKARTAQVRITYHDVSGRLRNAADAFRQSGVFEQVAAEVERHYSLNKPVEFNAKRCGEANAFYDSDTVEIIFCYELMEDFISLAAKDLQSKGGLHLGPGAGGRISQ
ncbi:DUF4344 domain-containing metallopeptidase [Devosia nitrariae]|uniref:Metallopeptidase n=1 Tax=Devosia nitrariae TaxID=2071872 RepID=A0ABQ5W675_9HYPH|nr:DUF4344 domain-containing metallopeptidase [Devosia nitrariae]GLQ55565.1 hypothetical protein GCM10010862_28240 [Devosia nitrariae]